MVPGGHGCVALAWSEEFQALGDLLNLILVGSKAASRVRLSGG